MINIKQFTTEINNRGVLKNNKYLVHILFPQGHYLANRKNEMRTLQIRCDAVSLPGVQFASADGPPRLGYGPMERHPYNVMFNEMNLSFIVDASSEVHKTLYDWSNCIVNYKAKGASSLFTPDGPVRGSDSNNKWVAYEVGYRDQYAATIQVEVFKDSGNNGQFFRSMTVTAFNAFPMGMPSVGMDWNASDIVKLKVPFVYTDYQIDYENTKESVVSGGAQTAPTSYDEALTLEQNFDNIFGQ